MSKQTVTRCDHCARAHTSNDVSWVTVAFRTGGADVFLDFCAWTCVVAYGHARRGVA